MFLSAAPTEAPPADKNPGEVRIKSVTVEFVKSKDGDDAASLMEQFGIGKDQGNYKSLLKGIEKQLEKGDGATINSERLGDGLGSMFDTIGDRLKDQMNHDLAPRSSTNGPKNDEFNDCSMTTFRLAIPDWMNSNNVRRTAQSAGFGTGDGDNLVRDGGMFKAVDGAPRVGDLMRLDDGTHPEGNASHYMTYLFKKDDGTAMAFSRSGVNGRFEVNNVSRFAGYGPIRGVRDGQSGFYRKK